MIPSHIIVFLGSLILVSAHPDQADAAEPRNEHKLTMRQMIDNLDDSPQMILWLLQQLQKLKLTQTTKNDSQEEIGDNELFGKVIDQLLRETSDDLSSYDPIEFRKNKGSDVSEDPVRLGNVVRKNNAYKHSNIIRQDLINNDPFISNGFVVRGMSTLVREGEVAFSTSETLNETLLKAFFQMGEVMTSPASEKRSPLSPLTFHSTGEVVLRIQKSETGEATSVQLFDFHLNDAEPDGVQSSLPEDTILRVLHNFNSLNFGRVIRDTMEAALQKKSVQELFMSSKLVN